MNKEITRVMIMSIKEILKLSTIWIFRSIPRMFLIL